MEKVREAWAQCTTGSALKPRFYQPPRNKFIKASQVWERVSIDFKGPLTTFYKGNKCLLIVVDEYSQFPFAFGCKDTSTLSVTALPCCSVLQVFLLMFTLTMESFFPFSRWSMLGRSYPAGWSLQDWSVEEVCPKQEQPFVWRSRPVRR